MPYLIVSQQSANTKLYKEFKCFNKQIQKNSLHYFSGKIPYLAYF